MPIEVQTTQNVIIDYEPAGLGYRLLAYLIDWLVIITWLLGWICIIFKILPHLFGNYIDPSDFLFVLLWVAIAFPIVFYELLFETLNNGQTPGKMLFKIRVVNTDGTAPSFGSYMLRWLFRLLDITLTEGLLAIITIAVTKKAQRLGDIVAGTTVVDLKPGSRNKVLNVYDLDFQEDYKVKYEDVLDKLSDRDIQSILSLMNDKKMIKNEFFSKRMADRVKKITGYEDDDPDLVFLNKIVSDYNYLALQ